MAITARNVTKRFGDFVALDVIKRWSARRG